MKKDNDTQEQKINQFELLKLDELIEACAEGTWDNPDGEGVIYVSGKDFPVSKENN